MGFLRRSGAKYSQHIRHLARRYSQSLKLVVEESGESSSSALIRGIHVFHCQDNVGIVAKISDCIASRGGNILNADIFVPENQNAFYARSEFVFDPAKWPRVQIDEDFSKISKMFNAMRSIVRVPSLDPKYNIAVLASKQDHCLVDLLHGWQDKRLPVNIIAVLSNHNRDPDTHVIRFLERHGIPYHHLDATKKDKGEGDILNIVKDTDFLVLARYMQILSGNFLRSYGKDIINIHHGLLPSFKGGNPSKQAFDTGVKLIGATSHFVTEELDEGPIIEQMILMQLYADINFRFRSEGKVAHIYTMPAKLKLKVERVSHRDNLQSFVQKSENVEKQCLTNTIRLYCELRVLPYGKSKIVVL